MTIDELFATPALHLQAFDRSDALLLAMDRAAYRRSIFVDARIAPLAPDPVRVPLATLLAAMPRHRPQRIGWIFHVAQCGSTLLARAIDRPEANLVLREPMPLRQLGAMRAHGPATPHWQALLGLATRLAGRRYQPGLPTVVKANVPVNFMLGELAALDREAPAIFLHFALEPYLAAVLRAPGARQWVHRVTAELAPALAVEAGEVATLSDAQRAAALWLAQLRAFDAGLAAFPNSHSLDAERLFAEPGPVIAATARLFGAPVTDAAIAATLAGDLFATYSKNPAIAFDNAARVARAAEATARLAPEIAEARRWLAPRLAARPLPARLARPLVGPAPILV